MIDVLGVSMIIGLGSTGLGGFLATFCVKNKRVENLLYCLTAGIMLSIVCFELLPEALSEVGVLSVSLCSVGGGFFVLLSERLLDRIKSGEKSGLTVAIAIALHNFPEGMIIGSGVRVGSGAVSALVALHDIPEGIAAALPYSSKKRRLKGFLVAFLSGVPTVLGAIVGYLFSGVSQFVCALILAFSAGSMFYVIFSQIIPCSIDLKRRDFSGIMIIIGIILGLIIIGVI